MRKKVLVIGGIAIAGMLAGGWALAQSRPHGPGGFGPPFMHGGEFGGMRPGTMSPGMMGPGMMDPGAMRHMARGMSQGMGSGMGHGMSPGTGQGMSPGMMGMGHDAATMSQLRDIHALLANHDRIKRTVTNLPDGIRTVTESDDPQIAALIKTHVATMGERVKNGDDPGLPIESPALHSIFKDKDKIRTSYETTANGIVVVQTSSDPKTVAALQEHASEVSDLVRGGMAALHAAMMRNHGGMMHGPMMGDRPDDHATPNSR